MSMFVISFDVYLLVGSLDNVSTCSFLAALPSIDDSCSVSFVDFSLL
jgi:hypothetical protein